MTAGVPMQEQVHAALAACVKIDTLLQDHRMEPVLPSPVAIEFKRTVFEFLGLQSMLKAAADARGYKYFNETIKSHYLGHLAKRAHLLNPVFGWCYSGEDFMQKVKHMAAAATAGNSPASAARKIMEKYRRGMDLSLAPGGQFYRR
eukprot:15468397-Alexandrium_andersonii.AAC.1